MPENVEYVYVTTPDNANEIIIHNIRFDDGGKYRCSGRNTRSQPAATHDFDVSVECKYEYDARRTYPTLPVAMLECWALNYIVRLQFVR